MSPCGLARVDGLGPHGIFFSPLRRNFARNCLRRQREQVVVREQLLGFNAFTFTPNERGQLRRQVE